jgi:hypothetical protein
MSQSLDRLARRIAKLEKDVHNAATQPRLGHSSLDGGAIYVFDPATGMPTGIFGRQYDGTTSAAAVGGTWPEAPSQPFVTEIVGGLRIYWDGTYADGSPTRMDFTRVSVHAVLDVGLIDPLDPAQLVGEITSATGGEITVGLPYVEHFIYLITWTEAGKFSVESEVAFGTPRFVGSGDLEPGAVGTDGLAPTEQPVVTATAGFKSAMLTWPGITNADPVWYEIAASPTNGFTPVAGDVVGNTTGTMANIVTAHSPVYIRVRAIDGDGAGPWSDQDSVTPIAGIDQAALNAALAAVEADIDAVEATVVTVQTDLDTAEGLITAAQSAADAAQATATAAGTTATAAQTTANGKNKVTYSTAAPGSTANTAGDVWFQRDGGTGRIIAMFEGTGGTGWTQRTLDGLVIAAIDAGTITTGTLSAARIAAGSLSIGQVNTLQATLDGKETPTGASAKAAAAAATALYLNTNPGFDDWPSSAPTGYTAQGGTALVKETSIFRSSSPSARWNVTNAASNGNLLVPHALLSSIPFSSYIVVEAEVFLNAGGFGGSGIWVEWTGTAGVNESYLRFDDAGLSPTTGQWYRFTRVLKRPATATGTQTSWTAQINGNLIGSTLGTPVTKEIIFDRVGFRPATAEEILAYESTAAIAGAQATAISTAASGAATEYGETKTLVAGWRVTGQTTINGGAIATDSITAVQIAANAITASELAALSVTAGKIAANAVTATEIAALTITGNEIAANAITAAKIQAGTITALEIAADYVYTGVVTANQVVSGSLSAVVALLGEISTATTGRRITISSADGFRAIDAAGDTLVQIPTDSNQDISIKADVVANSITATGPVALRSDANELTKASKLILRGATAAPSTPPIVTPTWQAVAAQPTNPSWGRGGTHYAAASRTYQAWSDGVNSGVWVFDNAGAHVTGEEWTVSTSATLSVYGVGRLGATIYLLLKDTTAGNWLIRRVDATTHATIGADFTYGTIATYASIGMHLSSTALITVTRNVSLGQYRRRAWTITGEIAPSGAGSNTLIEGGTLGVAELQTYGEIADIYEGAAEGGMASYNSSTNRLFIAFAGTLSQSIRTYSAGGAANLGGDSNYAFPLAFNEIPRMLVYNDASACFITYGRDTGNWYYYDGTRWTTESSTWRVTTTWRDSDATGGTHETTQGPAAVLGMKKRARLAITAPPIPDAGGTDDPNAVSIYIGRGDGSRTTQWRQATPADGVRTAIVQTVTFSGTNPPAANDFPAGVPAAIVDGTATATLLDGNGDATLRNVTITGGLSLPSDSYFHVTKAATQNVNAGTNLVLTGTTVTIDHPGGQGAYVITASIDIENTGGNGVLSISCEDTSSFALPGEAVFKGSNGDRATVFQQWGWYPSSAAVKDFRLRATNASGAGAYSVRQDHTKVFVHRVA